MTCLLQERKYNDGDEAARQNGRVPCAELAELFAFASSPEPGLPPGVGGDALLRHVAAWLRLRPEPRWELDMDGSPAEESEEPLVTEGWRLARDQVASPLRLAGGSLKPRSLASPSTSFLKDSASVGLSCGATALALGRFSVQYPMVCHAVTLVMG